MGNQARPKGVRENHLDLSGSRTSSAERADEVYRLRKQVEREEEARNARRKDGRKVIRMEG
jgi:hypothetical protein